MENKLSKARSREENWISSKPRTGSQRASRASATRIDAMGNSIPVTDLGMEFHTWDQYFTITDVHGVL